MFGLRIRNPESVFYEGNLRQLAATLTVNIIAFSHGIALGWVAPLLLKLQSPDSPLMFDISVEEVSWIGSLISVGGMIGNVIFGILLDLVGRKVCFYLLAVPHICLWVVVYFTANVNYLYICRVLGGITGGGVFVVIPIFVSEISNRQIRGTLGSLLCFSINIGILSGFMISSWLPYSVIPCVVVVLPLLYELLWTQFPETPHHLLRQGLYAEAENALKFYRNYKNVSKEDYQQFNKDFSELKLSIQSSKDEKRVSLKDFCTKRSLKALFSGITLIFVNVFSGVFPIVNYASMIFSETRSSIDPNTNTIIIGTVQIIGSYCATILVDKFGRKVLMMASTSGMCLGLTAIGVFTFLSSEMDMTRLALVPVVLMSVVIFAANIGVIAVTFVLLAEILPPKIRSLGSTICLFVLSIFAFVILKLFPILMATIGLSGVMWCCALISGFGFFFVLLCLKETKGKCLDNDGGYD